MIIFIIKPHFNYSYKNLFNNIFNMVRKIEIKKNNIKVTLKKQ